MQRLHNRLHRLRDLLMLVRRRTNLTKHGDNKLDSLFQLSLINRITHKQGSHPPPFRSLAPP